MTGGDHMTLAEGKINHTYTVEHFKLPVMVEKRLEVLGMTRGTKVSVTNKKDHGTEIVKIRGTRFAIGKGITDNIIIKD